MKNNNSILTSIASLGSATLINSILAFIVGILTRNILGPEKYGYWLTISLIFTFTPIFQLGILNAMNREVPFYLARKDFERVKTIRESVFSFIFTIPFFLVLLLCVISILLFVTEIRAEYKFGLLLASIIAGMTYLSGYAEMFYKSEQNFKKASKLISIKSISQSVFTTILVFLIGYLGLYLGMIIAILIEIIVAKDIFPKNRRKHNYLEYKKMVKIGMPILIVGIIWDIMLATDRLIISILMTPEELGNYGIGMLVFNTMMLFPLVLSQVFYPKIVELVSLGEYQNIKRFYWKINISLSIIMLFIVVIGYLILPIFITWFLPEYTQGIKAAQILLIGIYPLTLVYAAAAYFNSTNNQKVYIAIQVISIIINIFFSIILININKSITSVALATSITFTIYSIIMNTVFWLKIRVNNTV